MTKTIISVENLSKSYTLGQIGTGTFSHDLAVWWARARGKPNPLLRIGETDHGNRVGEEIWALKDVSFQVNQGEVLGVIGRNGAGKSTLLKILSRVTAPTSGEVKVKGRIASLLEVGTGFHPELTGRENIFLNGAILGMTKQEVTRKFDEIVDFSGVEKFIDTPVKRYSSGMYVRLAFAVAAHLESEILLVDEVLAVGDAEFQKKCLGKMGDVAHNEGRTVLFVSHNMGAVKSLCLAGIILTFGKSNYYNNMEDALAQYLSSGLVKDNSTRNPNTIGGFVPFIQSAIITDTSGLEKSRFFMNDNIVISVEINRIQELIGRRLGISVNSAMGVRIFIIDTDMQSPNILLETLHNNTIIQLEIMKNRLTPGSYSMDIIVADREGSRLELKENFLNFEILSADIFNNTYLISSKYGLTTHTEFRWRVKYENK